MIKATNLYKKYRTGSAERVVLDGVNIEVSSGDFVAIMGPSGAGKSTLLYQLGLLDHPSSGSIIIDKQETTTISGYQRTNFRLKNLGFVFQDYALLPELTAVENVIIPCLMQGCSLEDGYLRATNVMTAVGLSDRKNNLPSQLSGGEQQRVAIARAIAHNPKILFADEPTASLDSQRSLEIIKVFIDLNKEGQTIIMVTHEEDVAKYAKRVVQMRDGKIVSDKAL